MLALCNHFFDSLNEQGIRYCHWKSNEHLERAICGKTDLDLLVAEEDEEAFRAALSNYGFKCILSQPDKRFPGLEDYLGLDEGTGELVHLHVHYRLILGQRFIKNHHLPLESLIFDNLTQKSGVNIPCPEIELILLIIRAHLKADLVSLAKHAIKDVLGERYTAFPADIEAELRELHQSADPQRFSQLLQESGLPLSESQCGRFLGRLCENRLRFYHIMFGHYSILNQLRAYRRNRSVKIYFTYFRHYLFSLPFTALAVPPKRKTLIGPGKAFSIVGADGSGKSTLIRDLSKWLSWKMTVSTYYYGIPKNGIRAVSAFLVRAFNKLGLRSAESCVSELFWLYVGKYRKTVSGRVIRDTHNSKIVITDRFPLRDFRKMNEPMDNPRIDASKTLFGRNMREMEENYYNSIQMPDLILVLQVDISELRKRKSDITLDKHKAKANAVNRILEDGSIVIIDANKSYTEVLLEAKRHIWQAL